MCRLHTYRNPNQPQRFLLESVRRKSCEAMLLDDRVSLSEIADRLCYSEQSAFTRAFKGWYGQTPKAYARSKNTA